MKNIKKLLNQNPNFNLQKDNLARLSVQEKFNWGRLKKEKWLPQLQIYQRLYRIHPDETVVEQLMQKGYHSAHQIAATSEQQFTQKINGSLGEDPKVSKGIWQKSQKITYQVNQMAMGLRPMPNDTAVMQKSVAVTEAMGGNTKDNFETDIPAYNELFGPQYYCQCDECKSIWGPAAYFTDLMTTIEENISLTGDHATIQETPFIFIENDQLKDVKKDVVSNANIPTESVTINDLPTEAYYFDGDSCFELNKENTVFLPDGVTFECTFNLQEINDSDHAALFDSRDYNDDAHGITIYFHNTGSSIRLEIWLEGNTNEYTNYYITLDTWYTFRIMVYQSNIEFWLTPQDNSGTIYTETYPNHPYSPSAIGRLRVGAGKTSIEDADYHWKGYIKDPIFSLIELPKLSLQARRPDLWTMELNCANTNTEIPYLQVVNEVMANKLAIDLGEEVPTYIAKNVYPFNLPINLPEEEIKGYLEHFGFSQPQVLEYLQADDADIARTVFGISTNQLAFLTGKDASTGDAATVDNDYLSQVYGLYEDTEKGADTATTNAFITSTNNFLRKTGLTINDLSDLFYQNNPAPSISKNAGIITISPTAEEATLFHQLFINLDEQTNVFLNYLQANYDQYTVANSSVKIEVLSDTISGRPPLTNTLARLQRFIRLAQKINWTFTDLDWALKALSSRYMNETAIIDLAKVQTIMNQFSIPVDEATALFANIKTYGQGNGTVSQTLFDKIFNQPNNFNNADVPYHPAFTGNPFFTDDLITWDYAANLNKSSSESSKIRSSILASLHITEADLAVLLGYFQTNELWVSTSYGVELTVENLSLLYRYSQLPKLLKIPIPQFCALLPLLPTTTFDNIDDLGAVIQHIQTAQQSLLSAGQINYLLRTNITLPQGIQVKMDRQQQLMLDQLQQSATTVLLTPKIFVSPHFSDKAAEDLFTGLVNADYINVEGIVLEKQPILEIDLLKFFLKKEIALIKVNLTAAQKPQNGTSDLVAQIPEALQALDLQWDDLSAEEQQLTTQTGIADLKALVAKIKFIFTTLLQFKVQQNQLVRSALASFYQLSVSTITAGMVLTKRQLATYTSFDWTTMEDIVETVQQRQASKQYNTRYLLIPLPEDDDHKLAMDDYLSLLPRNLSWLEWNQLTPLEGLIIAKNPTPLGIEAMGYGYEPTFSDLMAISLYKQQCATFDVKGLKYLSYLETETDVNELTSFIYTKETDLYISTINQIANNNNVNVDTETINGTTETVFTFNGEDAYLEIENNNGPILPTAFTFNCSFLFHDIQGDAYRTIFDSRERGPLFAGITLYLHHDSNQLEVRTYKDANTYFTITPITAAISSDIWYDLEMTVHQDTLYLRVKETLTDELITEVNEDLDTPYIPIDQGRFRIGAGGTEGANTIHLWSGKISNPVFALLSPSDAALEKRQTLAHIAQWDLDQQNFLIDAFTNNEDTPPNFNTIQGVQTLINCFSVAQKMGIDTSLVWQLNTISPLVIGTNNENWTQYTDVASEYKNAFILHYGADAYQVAIAPLQGQIDERTRDFLTKILIWDLGATFPDIKTLDQLYDFLLLDVEMTSVVNISTLKLGLNSLQLYIQRCMMNLEQAINCTIPKEWWSWMSEYRTWQVNREVYLYPENYLDPALRKLRSPLFDDLVDNVKQSAISKDSVTSAYNTYLNGLKEIANLEIVDSIVYPVPAHPGETNPESHKLITLFGRTFADPTTYYYRTGLVPAGDATTGASAATVSEENISWTPWAAINLNILSNYVTPVFAFGKLFVFWVTQQQTSSTIDGTTYPYVSATINYAYQQIGADWSVPQVLASDILICAMDVDSNPLRYYSTSFTQKEQSDYYNLKKWQKVEVNALPSSSYKEATILITLGDKVVATDFNLGDTLHQTSPEQKAFYERIETVDKNLETVGTNYTTILPSYLLTAGLVASETEIAIDTTNTEAFEGIIIAGNNGNQLKIAKQYDFGGGEVEEDSSADVESNCIISMDSSNDYIYDFDHKIKADNWSVTEKTVTINSIDKKAFYFNGAANFKLTSNGTTILPGHFRFSCFFKLTETGDQYQIFDTKDSSGNGIGVYVDNRTLKLRLYDEDYGGGSDKEGLYDSISSNTWYEFAIQVNASNHTAQYWVKNESGVKLVNDTYNFSDSSKKGYTTSSGGLYIGRSKDDHDYFFKGYITDLLFDKYVSSNTVPYIGKANNLMYNSEQFVNNYVFSWSQEINDEVVDAAWFDKSAYYEINQPGTTILPDAFSFYCKFSVNDLSRLQTIFCCRNLQSGKSEGISVFYDNDGTNKICIEINNEQEQNQQYSLETSIAEKTWYDLFFFIDDTKINYILEVSDATTESDTKTIDLTNGGYVPSTLGCLRLGAGKSDESTPDEYWGGYIQNPTFYEGASTAIPVTLSLENIPSNSAIASVKNQRSWFTLQTNTESFLAVPLQEIPITDTVFTVNYQSNGFVKIAYSNALANASTLSVYQYIRLSTNVIEPLIETIFSGGLSSLLVPKNQYLPEPEFSQYIPNGAQEPSSLMNFSGANGIYFWELFYHIPMYMARNLQTELQFQAAQQWYDVIFDPMLTQQDIDKIEGINGRPPTPTYSPMRQYLLFRPFQTPDYQSIYEVLSNEPEQVQLYEYDPFDPNAIAALRPSAYAKSTVMQYISNLIDYGDYLFTEDSWESINSAAMYYTTAQRLLGGSPLEMPEDMAKPDKTYQDFIEENDNNPNLPTFLVDLEFEVPDITPSITGNATIDTLIAQRKSMMSDYFCVPSNNQLETYRQTVADRLYKIRSGLDINGQVNDIPLFQPPIDPAAAVAAAANGGAGAVSSLGTNVKVPYYRFSYLIGVAKNFTSQVISFGSQLLSALEKQDAEYLGLLRENHSNAILNMTTQMKEDQINQLYAQKSNLEASLKSAEAQRDTYQQWIDDSWNGYEISQITARSIAIARTDLAATGSLLAAPFYAIPTIYGVATGGMKPGKAIKAGYNYMKGRAEFKDKIATLLGMKGSFERTNDNWELQLQTALNSVDGINAQITGIDLQIDAAIQEYNVNQKQINQSNDIINFLQTKFTNEQLYQWIVGQVSTIYFQAYQVAYNMANMAQAAFQYELCNNQVFISNTGWNDLYKGLTAGEALSQGLQQLEQAYVQQNNRYLEIEKTISLLQLQPQALIDLKTNGTCTFSLIQQLFDLDFPGHYQRKITSLAVTIPAIVGPYQNIHATLTQTGNKIATKATVDSVAYLLGINDTTNPGSVWENWNNNQAIAVSTANNDSGMFQLNFNDSRYLFFEGTGAVSDWQLDMPKASNQFNFESISDVIINLRYTAYDGGEAFRNDLLNDADINPILKNYEGTKYFSMRQYYGTAWQQLLRTGSAEIVLTRQMFIPNLTELTLDQANSQFKALLTDDTTSKLSAPTFSATDFTNGAVTITISTHGSDTSNWADVLIQIPYTGTLGWGVDTES